MDLVVGVDAGGTATRAVVASVSALAGDVDPAADQGPDPGPDGASEMFGVPRDAEAGRGFQGAGDARAGRVWGRVVGRGRAGPGNPHAVGGAAAAEALAAAVRQALSGLDPADVRGAVVGVAGFSRLADSAVASAFSAAWRVSGVDCPVWNFGDAAVAFASGTAVPSGSVLISGTGAVAAVVSGGRLGRVADGLGWLIGDQGSGFWLGLRAVRTVARTWSRAPQRTPVGLGALVAAHAGVSTVDGLIAWVHAAPRSALAGLAPVVCGAARDGDPDAGTIVADAVRRLVSTLDELDAADAGPVVLAGGVLAQQNPVREGVLAVLRGRGVEVGTATDPAAGAAWLAARTVGDLDDAAATRLHADLCARTPAQPGRTT